MDSESVPTAIWPMHYLLMGQFAAVDVHYPAAGGARAALVAATEPRFTDIVAEHVRCLPAVPPYQPGRFYLRELPAIRAVLTAITDLDLILIDGYVDLDPDGRPGLGAHLHAATGTAVIGVAKTPFRTASHALTLHRGTSTRPLYVTAAGIAPTQAATLIANMTGPHRLPDALRRVDTLARTGQPAQARGIQ